MNLLNLKNKDLGILHIQKLVLYEIFMIEVKRKKFNIHDLKTKNDSNFIEKIQFSNEFLHKL
jgi:hypothetical protein